MTTTSTAGRAAVVLLLALGCVACGGTGPTAGELTRWMNARSGEVDDGALGAVSGQTSRRGAGASDNEEGVTMTFARPEQLDGLRLSCFGDTTTDFTVVVTTDDDGSAGTLSMLYEDVRCGEEDHAETLAVRGVTRVRVSGTEDRPRGAWHAVLLGEPQER